jgi:hypothetical protein
MIVFIILKLNNSISLSWWWILATLIPFAPHIAFIAFKNSHFSNVSWWWLAGLIIEGILSLIVVASFNN